MKQTIETRLYDIQIDKCCDLTSYIHQHPEITNDELTNRWKSVFFLITKRMGFNKEGRRYLWDQLAYENWTHLHQTDVERGWDRETWLENFADDLWHCSDRMNMTRLTRLHWAYRQIIGFKE